MIHNSIAQSIPFRHEHAHNKSHSHSQLQENGTAEIHTFSWCQAEYAKGKDLPEYCTKVHHFTCPENKIFSMILAIAEVARLFINWSEEEKNSKCILYKKRKYW